MKLVYLTLSRNIRLVHAERMAAEVFLHEAKDRKRWQVCSKQAQPKAKLGGDLSRRSLLPRLRERQLFHTARNKHIHPVPEKHSASEAAGSFLSWPLHIAACLLL